MDNVLLFTILMIFATAFIGSMIRYRTKDKCLKAFRGFFVTLERKGGKRVWGALDVYHNALELQYPSPHLDPDGSHFETSYILYQEQFGDIVSLMRMHDELSPENKRRRARELERTYHPSFFQRTWRRIRNLFNLLRDAFAEALALFIGQVKKAGTSRFMTSQDARLSNTTSQVIKSGASAYEPILEKYIGRKVVLEVDRGDDVAECCGVLKDYTDKFISVLNVPVMEAHEFNLADLQQLEVNENLDFEVRVSPVPGEEGEPPRADLHLRIDNRGKEKVEVSHAEAVGFAERFDRPVEGGTHAEFELKGVPLVGGAPGPGGAAADVAVAEDDAAQAQAVLPQVRLWIRANRYMDLVVPRESGTVRHGAESVGQLRIKMLLKLVTP